MGKPTTKASINKQNPRGVPQLDKRAVLETIVLAAEIRCE